MNSDLTCTQTIQLPYLKIYISSVSLLLICDDLKQLFNTFDTHGIFGCLGSITLQPFAVCLWPSQIKNGF